MRNPLTLEQRQAVEEGEKAFMMGKSQLDNPYCEINQAELRRWWEAGHFKVTLQESYREQ